MYRMKDDMSGAAAVLGLFQALPKLALPVEVHGLIAATENMPSGTAQRPGDVVRAMNGLTIEIGNTDAEGRLTLADALAYAAKEIKPDEMLDLATLTGAIVVALGMGLSGVFATDDGLAVALLGAAEAAGEKMWRLPLHDEYKEGLKSDIADLNNISSQRGGGAIVAGLFMRDFTAGARGRTSTSRARPSPSASSRSGPRAPRASACAPSWLPHRARRQVSGAGGVDLHTHTTASDGTLTPAELVAEACGAGVRVLAVTDHDSTEGLAEAMAEAARAAARSRSSRASRSTATSRAPRSTSWATAWTGRRRGSRTSAASSGESGARASTGWSSGWPRSACRSRPTRSSRS